MLGSDEQTKKNFVINRIISLMRNITEAEDSHGIVPWEAAVVIWDEFIEIHDFVLKNFYENNKMIPVVKYHIDPEKYGNSPTLIQLIKSTTREIADAMDITSNTENNLPSNISGTRQISTEPNSSVENIIVKFHEVAKQLTVRRQDRDTLTINDEYDVQDLLHSLLKLHFDDIRLEEWNPSYAGSSTKVDFLIPDNRIVIECKKTRKGLGNKELKEELIIDKEQYQKNTKCKLLYCLVYDPEERITNPRGFEKDLNEKRQEFECKVFVIPRHWQN